MENKIEKEREKKRGRDEEKKMYGEEKWQKMLLQYYVLTHRVTFGARKKEIEEKKMEKEKGKRKKSEKILS